MGDSLVALCAIPPVSVLLGVVAVLNTNGLGEEEEDALLCAAKDEVVFPEVNVGREKAPPCCENAKGAAEVDFSPGPPPANQDDVDRFVAEGGGDRRRGGGISMGGEGATRMKKI